MVLRFYQPVSKARRQGEGGVLLFAISGVKSFSASAREALIIIDIGIVECTFCSRSWLGSLVLDL